MMVSIGTAPKQCTVHTEHSLLCSHSALQPARQTWWMVPSKKTGSAKSADLCAYTCVYSLSLIQLFATPWIIVARLLCLWNSPGKNIGAGCYFLLQGNLPNLGIKPRSPALQVDSLPSEPPEKPWLVLYHVAKHDWCRIQTERVNVSFFSFLFPFWTQTTWWVYW